MKKSSYLYTVFFLAVLTDLYFVISGNDTGRFVSKPLLLLSLMAAYISEVRNWNGSALLFNLGLLFSWAGDILLMFEYKSPVYFIGGLSAFLAAHFCYIFYFIRIGTKNPSNVTWSVKMRLAGVIIYIGIFLWILWPGLNELKLPVTIYALTIGTMLATSILLKDKINSRYAIMFFAGAVLFVVSDSLLALNKFRQPLPLAGPLIMITYCSAQFILTRASAGYQNSGLEKESP